MPLEYVKIIESTEMGDFIKDYNELLDAPEGYKTIDEYLEKNLLPYGDELIDVCFRLKNPMKLKYVSDSFEKFFKKRWITTGHDGDGKLCFYGRFEHKETIQKEMFIDWLLSDFKLLDNITIVYPTSLISDISNILFEKTNSLYNQLQSAKKTDKYKIMIYNTQKFFGEPLYSEIFEGTFADANKKAYSLMEEHNALFKKIEPIRERKYGKK